MIQTTRLLGPVIHLPERTTAHLVSDLRSSTRRSYFRRPGSLGGLVHVDSVGDVVEITKGGDLMPIIVDRIDVVVLKGGKSIGCDIPTNHLNAMLKSRVFLNEFPEVDLVSVDPVYLSDFRLSFPGYNDGPPGFRVMYCGSRHTTQAFTRYCATIS